MREKIYRETERKEEVNGNYKWEVGNFTHHASIFY